MKKALIALSIIIALVVIMVLVVVEYWTPDGVYEGTWTGVFVSDEGERQVRAVVDEQSRSYGHIELYFDGDDAFESILPMHYDQTGLWLDESAGDGLLSLGKKSAMSGKIRFETEERVIEGFLELIKE